MIAAALALMMASGAANAVPSADRQFYICQLLTVGHKDRPAEIFSFTYVARAEGEVPQSDWEVDDSNHVLPDLSSARMTITNGYPSISAQSEGKYFNLMLTGEFSDNPKKPSVALFTGTDRQHSNYTKLGRCENVPADALKQSLGAQ